MSPSLPQQGDGPERRVYRAEDRHHYSAAGVNALIATVNELEAEVERLREAVEYALDASTTAGTLHHCDYCRADAAVMDRVLGGGTA